LKKKGENKADDAGADDNGEQDDEHDEPKATKNFIPSNILIILVVGMLSKHCEPVLNYVCDEKANKELASVPS